MKTVELRKKEIKELQKLAQDHVKKLNDLRFKFAANQLKNVKEMSPSTRNEHEHGFSSPQRLNQFLSDFVNIACAQGKNDLSPLELRKQPLHDPLSVGDKLDFKMSLALDRLIKEFTTNLRDRLLACRIDLGQDQPIRPFKGDQKIVEQIAGAAVAMGLKDHRQWAIPTLPDGLKSRPDLRGMVSVVVDHRDSPSLSLDFKATVDAGKRLQRLRYLGKRNLQLGSHRHCGQGICGAVATGQPEP